MKRSWVYIMASGRNGTLYTGFTSRLRYRVYQHRNKLVEGFTKKYNVTNLVYFEEHADINDAIAREKCLKGMTRTVKLCLIEKGNPLWQDLFDTLG